MRKSGIDYYLITTGDYHSSEYICDYFKTREYMSGFTGSAGTMVVSANEAALWTDGRYHVQAEKELSGSEIVLFKEGLNGVPSVSDYLADKMKEGDTLGFDGNCVDAHIGIKLEKKLCPDYKVIKYGLDLVGKIWKDRPAILANQIHILSDKLTGESCEDKLRRLRADMTKAGCDSFFLSKLDDIAWLFNIRGNDVKNNPVCMANAFVTKEKAILFVQSKAIHEELIKGLKSQGVEIFDYFKTKEYLDHLLKTPGNNCGCIMYDEMAVNFSTHKLFDWYGNVFSAQNPTTRYKAIKNSRELENIRRVYIKDSVILTRFLYMLGTDEKVYGMNEYSLGQVLDKMRLDTPGCMDLSFDTISAYGANAAMMHYEATSQNNSPIEKKGMYLVDSGGQYVGGTTDVTRTVAMGPVTDEERRDFTLTVMSMLRLQNVKFLYGSSGLSLDIIARQLFWEQEKDYKCGTGHGIGYMLNVHEGPQRIAPRHVGLLPPAVLEAGMIVSDEPGSYVKDKYGIRIENILEVVKAGRNENGQFMEFKPLTYVPIDINCLDIDMMSQKDKEYLDEYHRLVFEKISPEFEGEELMWLKEATRSIA